MDGGRASAGAHVRHHTEEAMIPGPMRLHLIIIILAVIVFALALKFL